MRPVLFLSIFAAAAAAQGIITTVAGTDYIFPDDGKPALQAHLSSPYGQAFDKQGNLYFADPGLNMVLKMDPKGSISIVAGNGLARLAGDGGPARAASLSTPWGIALDGAGNLYIADSGNSRVRVVDTKGVITSVAGGGNTSPGNGAKALQVALNQPVAVAFDITGNLLILERGNTRLRRVDASGTITTIAGTGQLAFTGDGGPAVDASLQSAEGLAVAPDGTIYIADANNGRVRRIAPNGIITTFAGGGNDPNASGGPATAVNLFQPTALAIDGQGNLYIAENSGNRVRRVSPQGILTNFAGTGQPGFAGDGKQAVQAQFANVFGISLDAAGNVYLSDRQNGRIRRVDASGILTTAAGVGPAIGDNGPAVNAVLAGPNEAGIGDIATDAQGNIFIADAAAQRIRKITPDGQISTVAGTGIASFNSDGIQAADAMLRDPGGIAVDAKGNLYIGDSNNFLVRKVDTTGVITTLARYPDVSYVKHVVVDPAGNVYFSRSDNIGDQVKKISPSGVVTTVAGTGTSRGFSGDGGPAASALLNMVRGLALDSAGNLYIADGNTRIRRVNPQGIITTVIGSGQSGDSGDGGPAANATLAIGAGGIVFDAAGNLYISTAGRVRRVGSDGIIRAWAGSKPGFSGDGGPALTAALSAPASLAITPQGDLAVWDTGNRRIRLVQATATSPSIIASQNGLTFIAAAGAGTPAPQAFTVVNGGTGTLNWGVSATTASGGNWLSVGPAGGSSAAGAAGPPVQVSVNPGGLAAGDYYGQIRIQAAGAPNSPQLVTVVLNVLAPGTATGSIAQPSGLIFTNAVQQSLTLSTLSNTPVTFSGTVSFGSSPFLNLAPASGTTVNGKPATVQIVPFLTGLGNGVYNANITFAFGDKSIQNVQILMVLSAGSAPQPLSPGARPTAGCAPTTLLPLFTSLGTGFTLTTGWPSPVELRVVDDCGQPLAHGTVTASFSNTDPALTLNSLGDGRWTGTWLAQNAAASVSITGNAQNADKSLSGSTKVSGGLSRNANPPPVVAQGGVLNAASYQLQGALAPGSLVSIFGSLLSQGAVSAPGLPLSNTLGGTTVSIAGRPLPLLYAGPDQVNAMVPYDLPINATHQVVVQRGTAISIPQAISVLSSQGGVFTKDLTGQGAGIVVRVAADGSQSVVSAQTPARAGEALVIYCTGLGDVDPRQIAGQQANFAPLSATLDAVKVTIGGIEATVFFAGLTPGFTGLYQVNAFVPPGLTPGDSVPLVITQAGRSAPPVTIAVR